jgi:uncharacterized membrane protein YdjX (TVP38/TMEM64 family)
MRPPRLGRVSAADAFRLLTLVAVFGGVLLLALTTDIFEDFSPSDVRRWVDIVGVSAPLLYVAGFIVRPFTLIPLTLWLLAGGLAFGWFRAALYAVLGVNLGAALVFFGARALGRDFVMRLLGRPRDYRQGSRLWGTRFVLSLQLLPFMPHDLLNLAAGCSAMPYWRFLVGSALGTIPGILLYTYAGSALLAPGSRQFYIAFAGLIILSITSLVWARWFRKEHDEDRELFRSAPAA